MAVVSVEKLNYACGVGTNDPELSLTDEAGSEPVAIPVSAPGAKQQPHDFLDAAKRNLSEDEMSAPAARRFLIADIERLRDECGELKTVQKDYNDLRVENAALVEKTKKSNAVEALTFCCSTLAAVAIGASPSFIFVKEVAAVGWIVLLVSISLVVAAAFVKAKQ